MKIYKEKQVLNDPKTRFFTLIPVIIGYYFTCLLGLWMDIVENNVYVITLAAVGVFTFTICLTLVVYYPYMFYEFLIKKTVVFDSDEMIVKSILSSKRIPYYGIRSCTVEMYGLEEAKVSIMLEEQKYKFSVKHMSALKKMVEEMKLHFPVEVK